MSRYVEFDCYKNNKQYYKLSDGVLLYLSNFSPDVHDNISIEDMPEITRENGYSGGVSVNITPTDNGFIGPKVRFKAQNGSFGPLRFAVLAIDYPVYKWNDLSEGTTWGDLISDYIIWSPLAMPLELIGFLDLGHEYICLNGEQVVVDLTAKNIFTEGAPTYIPYMVNRVQSAYSIPLPALRQGFEDKYTRAVEANFEYVRMFGRSLTEGIDFKGFVQSELDMMKINFQYISWAQFAIFDTFQNDNKRAEETTPYPAARHDEMIDNGGDNTPFREFVFTSTLYEKITTVEYGVADVVGSGYLLDTAKNWFTNECLNLNLEDASSNTMYVTANTGNKLYLSENPVIGHYRLFDNNPQYAIMMASYSDITNGGSGYIKMEATFDGGNNWFTFYDSENNINRLGGTVNISAITGCDYQVRITLKNDWYGRGPAVYRFILATDPSPWRY